VARGLTLPAVQRGHQRRQRLVVGAGELIERLGELPRPAPQLEGHVRSGLLLALSFSGPLDDAEEGSWKGVSELLREHHLRSLLPVAVPDGLCGCAAWQDDDGRDMGMAEPEATEELRPPGLELGGPHNAHFHPPARLPGRLERLPKCRADPLLQRIPHGQPDVDGLSALAIAQIPLP
jgi:hypothetical protein